MPRRHSIAEARSQFPALVREAESGKVVELTRRGEPVAVLIGRREYDRLVGEQGSFSERYATFREEVDLDELQIDPDEVFADARDRSRGREIDL